MLSKMKIKNFVNNFLPEISLSTLKIDCRRQDKIQFLTFFHYAFYKFPAVYELKSNTPRLVNNRLYYWKGSN